MPVVSAFLLIKELLDKVRAEEAAATEIARLHAVITRAEGHLWFIQFALAHTVGHLRVIRVIRDIQSALAHHFKAILG
jgi:hypothetical protein